MNEGGVFKARPVDHMILDRRFTGIAWIEADDDEAFTAKFGDFGSANADLLALRQCNRIENRIDAAKLRTDSGCVDVIVIIDDIGDAHHQRDIEGCVEIQIVDRRGIVCRRNDPQVHIGGGGAAFGGIVGDAVVKARCTLCIGIRGIDDIAITVGFETAIDAVICPEAHEPQGIAVDIAIVRHKHRNRNRDRHIFKHIDAVVPGYRRRIAYIGKIERDLAVVERALRVGDEIIKCRLAPEIFIWRKNDRAAVGEADIAIDGGRNAVLIVQESERETFGIIVVLQKLDDRNLDGNIFNAAQEAKPLAAIMIVSGDRSIIDRLIGDRRARPTVTTLPVAYPVIEPGITVEIIRRIEDHGLVFKQTRRAAMALADGDYPQWVAIGIAVVGQEPWDNDAVYFLRQRVQDNRIIFEDRPAQLRRGDAVTHRYRSIVDRRKIEIDARGRRHAGCIGNNIIKPGIAPIIFARGNLDHAIRIETDRHVGVRNHRLDRQYVAVDIAVVGGERSWIYGKRNAFGP